MADPHHTDSIEENIETHPLRVAIGVAIGAVALVIGIILIAQFAIGAYGERSRKDDPGMFPEAVEKRIAPVAHVEIDTSAPATTPAAPASAPAAVAATSPASPAAPAPGGAAPAPAAAPAKTAEAGGAGKKTFDSVCTACHSTGALGAPKFGDKAAWAPRIARGKDALYTGALHGKGAMPAKGGNPALSDADVKAAVDYMVGAAK